jgi:hypothetical protein
LIDPIVILQECTLRDASLKARAASLGFVAHQSSLDPSRQLVTWVRRNLVASVTDLVPGNPQGVVLVRTVFFMCMPPLIPTLRTE